MAADITIELATLRFDGKRFEGHALDVECTQELIAYRNLVVECAKDCASFEIMKARSITEALAHDQHFEQAGFTALLRR